MSGINGTPLTRFQFLGFVRMIESFGWAYDLTTRVFARTELIPSWLLPLRSTAAHLTGLLAEDFVQALLIRYDPGAGIGWLRDRAVFEHVIGMSLGAPALMRYQ